MKKTGLVTGASSGIGRGLARRHAAEGGDVVLVARSTSKLRELATELSTTYGVQTLVMPKDLSIPDAALELYDSLVEQEVEVTYLFNCAGFGDHGPFEAADWYRIETMMNVNMLALTHLTYCFGRDMVARGQGFILNVSSAGTFAPVPNMSVYYATKQFVQAFTEGLADEWRARGVHLTVLCPGPTDTDFDEKAKKPPTQTKLASPREVADAGYNALLNGTLVAIPSGHNKALSAALKWLPRGLRKGLLGEG